MTRPARRLFPEIEPLEARIAPATIWVTSVADSIALDGAVTLREAITAANTNQPAGDAPAGDAGLDTVGFNIPGAGVHAIALLSALPAISEAVILDATTQPGAVQNPTFNNPYQPLIALNGKNVGGGFPIPGLKLVGNGTTVKGLAFHDFSGAGILVESDGNVIARNYIGLNPESAFRAAGNHGNGITVNGDANLIGSRTDNFDGNHIWNNAGDGLEINGSDNVALGNFIGVEQTIHGMIARPNGGDGVSITGSFNHIGHDPNVGAGTSALANFISNNQGAGIRVTGAAQGNYLVHNFIRSNAGLGIDLGRDGVTANDPGDSDAGPNGLQNFPVITEVLRVDTHTDVLGTLNSTPNSAFTVHLHLAGKPDGAGDGEGDFLGAVPVTTDAAGNATFSYRIGHSSNTYSLILSATAIDEDGNTSEFSPAVYSRPVTMPVQLLNARTATFTDSDGDLVTVKVSKGTLKQEDFTVVASGKGGELLALHLGDPDDQFTGAALSISAVASALGGDGFVNVGFIDSHFADLGKVAVDGDLGRIAAAKVASLNVQSMGRFGYATQFRLPEISLESEVTTLGRLTVATDIRGASLHVLSDAGSIKVGGSIAGEDEDRSGSIIVDGTLGSLAIGRDLRGGEGDFSGRVRASKIGSAVIKGSIFGGDGYFSGSIGSFSKGRINVLGSVTGAAGADSGAILGGVAEGGVTIGGSFVIGLISSGSNLSSVKIGGDASGRIVAGGGGNGLAIGAVTIGGSAERLQIAAGADNADAQIGSIKVAGDWTGGGISAGMAAGLDQKLGTADDVLAPDVNASVFSRIASITIKGAATGNPGSLASSFFTAQRFGKVQIGGTAMLSVPGGSVAIGYGANLIMRQF